jgi:cell division protein FtsN
VQESVPAPVPEPLQQPVQQPVQQPARQPARAPVVPEAVPATPAAAPAPGATRYFVQVGTFATRERAEAAQKDLARRGFEVIINETTSGARQFHRVRVGPVADRATAVALEARLRPLAPDRAIVAVPPAP